MGLGVNLSGDSLGERIVMGLAILALCVEMLSDNGACGATTHAEPMTHELCLEVCGDVKIKRLEGFACECHLKGGS